MKKATHKASCLSEEISKLQHLGIANKAIVKKVKVYKNESSMHIQGFFITVSLADKHLTKSLVFIIH